MGISSVWNGWFKVRILLEGYNVEQALKKLQRAKIPLFSLKRRDKKSILLTIYRKDFQKALPFFGYSCYNEGEKGDGAYRILCVRPVGVYQLLLSCKKHIAFFLGGIFFISVACLSQDIVLRVRLSGDGARQEEEIRSLLKEEGVCPFALYRPQDAPRIVSRLLSLPDVSFASVQKQGYLVDVQVIFTPSEPVYPKGDLTSPAKGELLSLTVLSGEALVQAGDKVDKGDVLVRATKTLSDGTALPSLAVANFTLLEKRVVFFFTREEALLYYELFYGDKPSDFTLAGEEQLFRLTVSYAQTYTYR